MTLRVLLVEDSADDAALVELELRRAGYSVMSRRVDAPASFEQALTDAWDVVICDFNLPGFDAFSALRLMQGRGVDLPFIVVSGSIGEDTAVRAMREGAHDYLMKGNLARLGEAVRRELREREIRRERVRAERAFQLSENRFRTLFEMLPEALLVHSAGRVLYANPAAAQLFGHAAAEDLIGTDAFELMREDFRALARSRCEATLSTGIPPERTEMVFRRPDGSERLGEVEVRRIDFDGGCALLSLVRNITESRELSLQVIQMDRLASLGMVTAAVAHEVKNPLAYVSANLSFVEEELRELDRATEAGRWHEVRARIRELQTATRDSQQGAAHMREILEDLRMFSRKDDGRAVANVRHLLDSAVKLATPAARTRATLSVDHGEVPPVRAGESRLMQVVLNLVMNAIQAFPNEDPKRNRVRLISRCDGEQVVIEVEDNGPGIPPEARAKLFDPFFTTKAAVTGTGLGLSISRTIVRSYGGEIAFETELGRGTRFWVNLPVAKEQT